MLLSRNEADCPFFLTLLHDIRNLHRWGIANSRKADDLKVRPTIFRISNSPAPFPPIDYPRFIRFCFTVVFGGFAYFGSSKISRRRTVFSLEYSEGR